MTDILDLARYRAHFPALSMQDGDTALIFFDNPGGTQVPLAVAEAMSRYLLTANANVHGGFTTSRRTDEVVAAAHDAMADLLNAADSSEIVFGQNMTSLTFAFSRAIGRELRPGDEIVVTALDHDANIAPWRALEEQGAVIRCVDLDPADCTLRYEQFGELITERTRVVALGLASNAAGTINDVERVTQLAHAAGALVFVDAVQGVPHLPVDVQALGCDALVCSAYKFFGPHQGILWARRELLERLRAYKVRPASNEPPGKWETGTQSHEGQAGTLAAVEYLHAIGREHLDRYAAAINSAGEPLSGRRSELRAAMLAIRDYERELSRYFLGRMGEVPGLRLYGVADRERVAQRVPTFAVTVAGTPAPALAAALAKRGIAAWSGHYYAVSLVERLGLLESGGMLRIGCAHYNTTSELDTVIDALGELAG